MSSLLWLYDHFDWGAAGSVDDAAVVPDVVEDEEEVVVELGPEGLFITRLPISPMRTNTANTMQPIFRHPVFFGGGGGGVVGGAYARDAIGVPQFGQVGAASETGCLHSGH
jgi:hypothetical protein